MRKIIQKQTGFTIVELLIVIVIMGIMAGITVAIFSGVKAKADESLVKADLQYNTKRILLYQSEYGNLPSTVDLTTAISVNSGYKFKISKRSSYKFYGYCTAADSWGQPLSEIIQTVGTTSGKQYIYSSQDNAVRDVTSQMGTSTYNGPNTSSVGAAYKCWDFIKVGRTGVELRDMIHADGGVETGFIDVLAE